MQRSTCEQIIEKFEADDRKWCGKTFDGRGEKVEDKVKVSWDLGVRSDDPSWQSDFEKIHNPVVKCVQNYMQSSPSLKILSSRVVGYKIQMYPENEGHFDWHFDASSERTMRRILGLVLYLNDIEQGGETEFYHQKLKVKPQAGHGLIFPAGWTHMHRGCIPTSEKKYIISSFIELVLPSEVQQTPVE